MKQRNHLLIVGVVMALLALCVVLAAGCGSEAETTTTVAVETTTTEAVETTTTEAATSTTQAEASLGASGTIAVKGMVETPMELTVDSLKAMTPVTITATHPKQGDQEYTGVRFSDLATALKVQDAATTVTLGAADGFMAEVSMDELAASPDAMIAIGDDGKLNAVMPGMTGKAWVRDVISMDFK
ncbi:MAG: molybdopterin-dependent oxidoreductase [Gaiellales bacterium]|nr:molybdopterin-dependent oxidoreductase [Gaiellales bacterium]